MTNPGIHVNNVPIVADGVHIEVGVGFPCWDCAFLTSWKAERPPADEPTTHWVYWRPTNLTQTVGSSPPELYLVSDRMLYFAASLDWITISQALEMNDVNIWTRV